MSLDVQKKHLNSPGCSFPDALFWQEQKFLGAFSCRFAVARASKINVRGHFAFSISPTKGREIEGGGKKRGGRDQNLMGREI